jgi:hypothetical protein
METAERVELLRAIAADFRRAVIEGVTRGSGAMSPLLASTELLEDCARGMEDLQGQIDLLAREKLELMDMLHVERGKLVLLEGKGKGRRMR